MTRTHIKIYRENCSKPTAEFGNCPKCNSNKNKIYWGWAGAYYDLVCENGHTWVYTFKKQEASR